MFFYVLQAVQGSSQPGDLVHIEIQEVMGHLTLRVKHSESECPDRLCHPAADGIVQRALALAEAIVTSAGGEFNVSADPLLIVADFPVGRESRSRHRSTRARVSDIRHFTASCRFAPIVQDVLNAGTGTEARRLIKARSFLNL